MSAPVDEPKTVAQPEVGGTTEPAPAPVLAADNAAAPVIEEPKTEEAPKTETEPAAPAEEAKEEAKEEKVVEPIYSGTLGYKAPGLKK